MIKKLKLAAVALLLPLIAFAQTYPSPTFQNVTVRGTLTAATPAFTNPVPVSSGGTNCSAASGTCLDNITGFSGTGFLTRTGAGTYAFQSLTNGITYGNLAQAGANTLLGNATGVTGNVTAVSVAGCNGAAQALQWTNGSGFQCNSSIATSGANANITSLSGLTTPLSVAQGGSGRATLTAHGVLFGEGTAAINQSTAGTSGQPLLSGGASADPNWGTLAPSFGGTGLTTLTANAVMLGNGTGNVAFAAPVSAGFVLTDNGPGSNPTFQAVSTLSGRLIGVQRFTSSGTYTPDAGTNSVIVEVQGGGGAGGGGPATGASQCSVGAGGYSGAYAMSRLTTGFSGATVTVGAGGTGSAGASGGSGGNSAFGTITAAGGPGGLSNGPSGSTNGNNSTTPPTAANGSIVNISGSVGSPAYCANSSGQVIAGLGAPSLKGSGGIGAANGTGGSASGFGAGGGGASQNNPSAAAVTGGNGSPGIVIVWEYN
jgi:hypothetical protein